MSATYCTVDAMVKFNFFTEFVFGKVQPKETAEHEQEGWQMSS
jgi:hypothetical protein